MKNQDEQTTRFEYENNKKVSSIERRYLDFDYNQDTDVFEITVHFRDGNIFSWTSRMISSYGNGLFIDSNAKYLFGCSLQGVYCCDLRTGKKIWQKRKMSKYIVMNADDTLTCEWHKQLFIYDIAGNIIKEIRTNYETSVFHIGNKKFLIRRDKSTWAVVSSQLDQEYVFPNSFIFSRIRSATISHDILNIRYWCENNGSDEQLVDLSPYKVV